MRPTVLEALRYALDGVPEAGPDKDRIERLIQHNLAGGSIRVELERSDKVRYVVNRAFGEPPRVTRPDGTPVDINIANDIVFGVDIYSQNEIERIANDAFAQLQLIDKGIGPFRHGQRIEENFSSSFKRDPMLRLVVGSTPWVRS